VNVKWLLVVLTLCACPIPVPEIDGGTLPDGGPCPKELVLGTEIDGHDFQALVDGADLKINQGPQGGWHVWVSVRATAMASSGTLSYVLRSSTQQVLSAPLRIDLTMSPVDSITCGWERRTDALVFMNDGEPFRGTTGELELSYGTLTVKRSVRLF
jgi:hypothetical protein